MANNQLTGGKVNYYLADVIYPRRPETQKPYVAECEDIIQALQMTFDEGCAFKAIWRTASARLGNGKPGHKETYDAEKIIHYGRNMLNVAQQRAGTYVTAYNDITSKFDARNLIDRRIQEQERQNASDQ